MVLCGVNRSTRVRRCVGGVVNSETQGCGLCLFPCGVKRAKKGLISVCVFVFVCVCVCVDKCLFPGILEGVDI